MKKFPIFLCFLFVMNAVGGLKAQDPEIIKLPKLEQILNPLSDTTYVINFWATWCKPCVKEMPHFEQLGKHYRDQKLKVILISLDFKRQYATNLIPFINKNKIESEVYLIDETDYNLWIDKVDPSWSGAIPATIIINKQKNIRSFHEREFNYEELNNIVEPIITKQL